MGCPLFRQSWGKGGYGGKPTVEGFPLFKGGEVRAEGERRPRRNKGSPVSVGQVVRQIVQTP